MKSLNEELLTVQILFEELELDCDEQIKQLDRLERKRNDDLSKQKRILSEVKFGFKATHLGSTALKSKSVCLLTPKLGKLVDKSKQRIPRVKHTKRRKIRVLSLSFKAWTFYLSPIFNDINNRLLTKKYSFLLRTDRSTASSAKKLISLDYRQLSNVMNSKSVDSLHFRMTRPYSSMLLSRLQRNVPLILISESSEKSSLLSHSPTKSNINRSRSLLDKYFDKYCNNEQSGGEKESNISNDSLKLIKLGGYSDSTSECSSSVSCDSPIKDNSSSLRKKTRKTKSQNAVQNRKV
jgi:hypothetical protein